MNSGGRRFSLIVCLWPLVACSGSEESQGTVHPHPQAFVQPVEPSDTLRLHPDLKVASTEATELASTWRSVGGAVKVGALDGRQEEVFGSIRDALVDLRGRLMVLDGQAREVRIFEPDGSPLQVLGGLGGGPGEFVHPVAMSEDARGQLFVFDLPGRVSVFSRAADSLSFSHSLNLELGVFDGCVMNERLFVHGLRPGDARVLHVFDLKGHRLDSFAVIYRTRNPIVRQQLSRGSIACVEAYGLVLLGPTLLPEIRAYSPSGQLDWWIAIDGFRPVVIQELANGGTRLSSPPGGFHILKGLVARVGVGSVLLEIVGRERTDNAGKYQKNRSSFFIVDVEKANGRYAGRNWPSVLYWSSRGLVSHKTNPYPYLRLIPLAAAVVTP